MKLDDALRGAKCQMDSYDNGENVKRIAFVVVNFDEWLGEYGADFFAQIDAHLASSTIRGLDIVFYNQRTVFHQTISMLHAHVVNEPS